MVDSRSPLLFVSRAYKKEYLSIFLWYYLFLLVCVINAGKGSYPSESWRVTWTERGCSVWFVMAPRQQNKVPDSETVAGGLTGRPG